LQSAKSFLNANLKFYLNCMPVGAGFVEKEEEYLLSSCGDFY